MHVAWSLVFRPDGAFREEYHCKHLSFSCGYDGGLSSKCWEVCSHSAVWHSSLAPPSKYRALQCLQVDCMKVPKSLALDDHEVSYHSAHASAPNCCARAQGMLTAVSCSIA